MTGSHHQLQQGRWDGVHLDQANGTKSENAGNPEFILQVIWLVAMTHRPEQPGWQAFDNSL